MRPEKIEFANEIPVRGNSGTVLELNMLLKFFRVYGHRIEH